VASPGEVQQQQAVVRCSTPAQLNSSGQVTSTLMHRGLSWYDTIDSPTFQSKKALEGKDT